MKQDWKHTAHKCHGFAHAVYFALAFLGWHDAYAYLSGALCIATLFSLWTGA